MFGDTFQFWKSIYNFENIRKKIEIDSFTYLLLLTRQAVYNSFATNTNR